MQVCFRRTKIRGKVYGWDFKITFPCCAEFFLFFSFSFDGSTVFFHPLFLSILWCSMHTLIITPQRGAADAEIKVPSGENTELKPSPFKAWSRSVHSYTCYAYCQGFLPCLSLPFWSIHLHFFKNLSWYFHSCVGPQNKIGHPAGCRFPCWVPAEHK